VPQTLRQLSPSKDVRLLQKLLHSNGYFRDSLPPDGLFDQVTHDEVVLFQLQHIDEHGEPLKPDGEVGPLTWWALKNPSGEPQRNHFEGVIPGGLTNTRNQLL
jgi:peptidoglycan hydrolase-like protein with peptidoglycan-binding domain